MTVPSKKNVNRLKQKEVGKKAAMPTRSGSSGENGKNNDASATTDSKVDTEEPHEKLHVNKQEKIKEEIKIIPPPASWYQSVAAEKECQSHSTSNAHVHVHDSNRQIKQSEGTNGLSSAIVPTSPPQPKPCNKSIINSTTTSKRITKTSPKRTPTKQKPTKAPSEAILQNLKTIQHVTTTVLPAAAQELITASARKAYHHTRISYSTSKVFGKYHMNYSEVGNRLGGYDRKSIQVNGIRGKSGEVLWRESMILDRNGNICQKRLAKAGMEGGTEMDDGIEESNVDLDMASEALTPKPSGHGWEDEWDKARISLPPFSSLPWVDRQLVQEWRTCDYLYQHGENEIYTDESNLQSPHSIQNNESEHSPSSPFSMVTDDSEDDFEKARTLLPQPIQKPPWENATSCYACRKTFGSILRHHCRLCGRSYCQSHSRWSHKLPHLGYSPEIPERVCAPCKQVLEAQNLAERIAWRMARCRDYLSPHGLCPYFDTGVDTVEDAAARLTKAAIHMAKSIPLGAQATMTVETLDVLRKHGLKGVYGLILRKEFMAAADLLCKVTGINKKVWPLSVHELSAAIFYALAQHRALRGVDPEREHRIHTLKSKGVKGGIDDGGQDVGAVVGEGGHSVDQMGIGMKTSSSSLSNEYHDPCESEVGQEEEKDEYDTPAGSTNDGSHHNVLVDDTDSYDPKLEAATVDKPSISGTPVRTKLESSLEAESKDNKNDDSQRDLPFDPVCEPVSDGMLSSLIFYAPLALNFIYATSEVDMQLLAAQQGWRLIYAHLNQDDGTWGGQVADKPASALFVHTDQKIACFAVRGTATINDVVTDIRAMPVQFPDSEMDGVHRVQSQYEMDDEGWTPVLKGQGLALCGMAGAACNLFRENIDAILLLAQQGYRIRLTGHSLGGSVAALLGALIKRHFEFHMPQSMSQRDDILRVYSYGSPACVDAKLSDYAQSYVINCVLHDDVIPRLTPTSIRALLKHLLYIRETWVKTQLSDDLMAITERAKTVWAPKLRNGFSLINNKGNPSVKVYKKLKAKGKSLRKKIKKGRRKLKSMSGGSNNKASLPEEEDVDYSNQFVEGEADRSNSSAHQENDDDAYDENDGERNPAHFFEGDCFYEAEESLIEYSDEESDDEPSPSNQSCDKSLDDWVPFDEPPFDEVPFDEPPPVNSKNCDGSDTKIGKSENQCKTGSGGEAAKAVLLEETPLPRMFIPGKIIHIYTHRGGYKAAAVPRAFRELRRISLAGSMLNDHTSKAYYEGLLECKTVRDANKSLPAWTGFSEEMTCCCCASRFTWASTSGSEAQEARDRHNCRACGGLVCDPCSSNRVPIPDIGINLPSRVCDRCYHDMGSVLKNDAMTRSFSEDDFKGKTKDSTLDDGDQFVADRSNPKRNPLVDELAMRMPSTTVSG